MFVVSEAEAAAIRAAVRMTARTTGKRHWRSYGDQPLSVNKQSKSSLRRASGVAILAMLPQH
jgi:hypothetical protein